VPGISGSTTKGDPNTFSFEKIPLKRRLFRDFDRFALRQRYPKESFYE